MENKELIMNEAIDNIDVIEDYGDTGSSVGILIGGITAVAAVAGGIAFYLHKTKAKREAKKIEKLKAKGYVIFTPEEADDIVSDISEDDE